MRDTVDISIVVANYNGAAYIIPCLKSVCLSTPSPQEIVVIDDGSTDNSVALIEQFIKNHTNVTLYKNTSNLGAAVSRNIGIQKTSGKYIVFVDNDTIVNSDWLSYIYGDFKQDSGLGAIQCRLVISKTGAIETSGHYMTITGFPYEVVSENAKQIFGARSACMAYVDRLSILLDNLIATIKSMAKKPTYVGAYG